MVSLINDRTQEILADPLEIAKTPWARAKGLLGRSSLPGNTALWIESCNSIHTWFMKFPIDVIYVNGKREVVKIVTHISPWHFSYAWGADAAIEWAAGSLEKWDIQLNDKLILRSDQ